MGALPTGQVPVLEAEQLVRDALDHPPESWSAGDKTKLATYAASFDLMWPINQKRVFGACCESVVWNRRFRKAPIAPRGS